jgi:protein tyrosine phosphatase (PTP) superfamily phosphohydrolase (DUF442 family)
MKLNWVEVGGGRLALSHRPRLKAIAGFAGQGCQRVLTLQGEDESPGQIGAAVRKAGLAWTWVKIGDGRFPVGKADLAMRQGLHDMVACLKAGESVLIHCSAGIHRTGMFTFALLRSLGLSEPEALEKIALMRPHTRNGMRPGDTDWGNQIAVEGL